MAAATGQIERRAAQPPHAPEHIIFAVDLSTQMGERDLKGIPCSRLDLTKESILMFVNAKKQMHPLHTFSVAAVRDAAQIVFDGRNRPAADVIQFVSALTGQHLSEYTTFEFGSLMDMVNGLKTDYLVRVVFVYGRSDVVPTWTTNRQGKMRLDVLYLHSRPEDGGCPQQVYDFLTDVADAVSNRIHHKAYIYELAGAQLKKVHSTMALSLSHTQQRVDQPSLRPPLDLSKENAQQPVIPPHPSTTPTSSHPPLSTAWPPSGNSNVLSQTGTGPSSSIVGTSASITEGGATGLVKPWKDVLTSGGESVPRPEARQQPDQPDPQIGPSSQSQEPSPPVMVDVVVPHVQTSPDTQDPHGYAQWGQQGSQPNT